MEYQPTAQRLTGLAMAAAAAMEEPFAPCALTIVGQALAELLD